MTEHFRCIPYSVNLSRSSCGKRHLEAARSGRPGAMRPTATACATCPIGEAHAKGKAPRVWPDGSAIDLVQLAVRGTPETMPAATPYAKRAVRAPLPSTLVRRGRKARLIEGPSGERKTIKEWARDLGVGPEIIHGRIGRGWLPADAVSAPYVERGSRS